MKPTLVILAAGIGSRFGGLKQAEPIGPSGESIIEYSIYDAIRAGFGKVVIVIRKAIEQDFLDKFGGKFDDKIEVVYAYQESDSAIEGIDNIPVRKKPWGTGHAMMMAEKCVDTPFLVINADDFYGYNAFQKMSFFLENVCSPKHFGMVGYHLKNTLSENGSVSRGVCMVDENNLLTNVIERTDIRRMGETQDIFFNENGASTPLADDTIVSMNFWGFHPSVFKKAKQMFKEFLVDNATSEKAEFYIPKIANTLIEEDRIDLTVMTTTSTWYGVTYPADTATVKNAFNALITIGAYPDNLWVEQLAVETV